MIVFAHIFLLIPLYLFSFSILMIGKWFFYTSFTVDTCSPILIELHEPHDILWHHFFRLVLCLKLYASFTSMKHCHVTIMLFFVPYYQQHSLHQDVCCFHVHLLCSVVTWPPGKHCNIFINNNFGKRKALIWQWHPTNTHFCVLLLSLIELWQKRQILKSKFLYVLMKYIFVFS